MAFCHQVSEASKAVEGYLHEDILARSTVIAFGGGFWGEKNVVDDIVHGCRGFHEGPDDCHGLKSFRSIEDI